MARQPKQVEYENYKKGITSKTWDKFLLGLIEGTRQLESGSNITLDVTKVHGDIDALDQLIVQLLESARSAGKCEFKREGSGTERDEEDYTVIFRYMVTSSLSGKSFVVDVHMTFDGENLLTFRAE